MKNAMLFAFGMVPVMSAHALSEEMSRPAVALELEVQGSAPFRVGFVEPQGSRMMFTSSFDDAPKGCRQRLFVRNPKQEVSRKGKAGNSPCEAVLTTPPLTLSETRAAVLFGAGVRARGSSELLARIEAWRTAWENSDYPRFASFYSPEVKVTPFQRNWLANKRHLMARRSEVRIELGEALLFEEGKTTYAIFTQKYRASGHSDQGLKMLVLRNGLIVEEKWARLADDSPWLLESQTNGLPMPVIAEGPGSPSATPLPASESPTAVPEEESEMLYSREIQFLPSETLTTTSVPGND